MSPVRHALIGAGIGGALGAALAAVLYAAVQRDPNPVGAGLGTAWLLWLVGLPWSGLVRTLAPEGTPTWLTYGAMPAVAWACWGALIGWWRARQR